MSAPPAFRFYPGCYDDGAMVRSEAICTVCSLARGWAYAGDPHGANPPRSPCPWCIADGRAASSSDGCFFNDVDDARDRRLAREVSLRTPSPLSWQDFIWPVSGGAPMIYEGCVDYESVKGDRKRLAAARAAADGDERVLRDWVGKEADVNIMMFRSRWGFAFVGIMDAS